MSVGVEGASNMAVERTAGSHSLAAAALPALDVSRMAAFGRFSTRRQATPSGPSRYRFAG
jgi:hypothetical protein